ncbi:MAG: arginyltransferase [Pseudomonadales bacterium]|nr:arginyltransferase [Pseudomonadales bacterium]
MNDKKNDKELSSKADHHTSTAPEQLRLYASAPQPCSYLEGMESEALFIDPEAKMNQHSYSYLSKLGFRRSGNLIYRPDCQHCQACIPIRIPVAHFKTSKSQKRLLKKNTDIRVVKSHSIDDEHFYKLYADYICFRHADGDMYPPSKEQYTSFLNNAIGCTEYFSFMCGDKLIAVAVIDRLNDGFSAVYTFYDPCEEKRSPGTLAVLWQIEHAKQLHLDYVYLGYWIKDSQKMQYKSRFKPAEILLNQQWRPLLS